MVHIHDYVIDFPRLCLVYIAQVEHDERESAASALPCFEGSFGHPRCFVHEVAEAINLRLEKVQAEVEARNSDSSHLRQLLSLHSAVDDPTET